MLTFSLTELFLVLRKHSIFSIIQYLTLRFKEFFPKKFDKILIDCKIYLKVTISFNVNTSWLYITQTKTIIAILEGSTFLNNG